MAVRSVQGLLGQQLPGDLQRAHETTTARCVARAAAKAEVLGCLVSGYDTVTAAEAVDRKLIYCWGCAKGPCAQALGSWARALGPSLKILIFLRFFRISYVLVVWSQRP